MSGTSDEPLVVNLSNARKTFGAVVALADGRIQVRPGEIHALVGENGAGKSTLIKVLAGLYHRDAGHFEFQGNPVDFRTVADSRAAGISVIYQEPTLFPDLTVAENIFIGRQPRGRFGLVSRAIMNDEAAALFKQLGVDLDPDRQAEGLSIADQQLIEIAKAISMDAKLLIMDEPTAALSGAEVERLFAVARSLRDRGAGLIFVSHRFDEVFQLCDRITVMRDGSFVGTHDAASTDIPTIVRQMVGRDVSEMFPKQATTPGDVILDVRGLSQPGVFNDVNLVVRAGEIVGLAGLIGSGRTEVARAIFGADPYEEGTVQVAGSLLPKGDTATAINRGMAFVPEDRRKQGLVMDLSVGRNTTLTLRNTLARFGLISSSKERSAAETWTERLRVKTSSLEAKVNTLSGGNQQKVVLAKWLATDPRLLIVDEPTRGIDVGTKAEVHRLLSDLAVRGIGILMISSELPEVLGMSDRVYVMREGRVAQEFSRAEATPDNVMYAATHGKVA